MYEFSLCRKTSCMANKIEWYGQGKQVILQTYDGETTWESFFEMATLSEAMIRSVEHPVHLIIDRSTASFPEFKPTTMASVNNMIPDNQDMVIVVGAEYTVETLSKIIGKRVAPQAFRGSFYVSTMEEAHAILKRERGIELKLDTV